MIYRNRQPYQRGVVPSDEDVYISIDDGAIILEQRDVDIDGTDCIMLVNPEDVPRLIAALKRASSDAFKDKDLANE